MTGLSGRREAPSHGDVCVQLLVTRASLNKEIIMFLGVCICCERGMMMARVRVYGDVGISLVVTCASGSTVVSGVREE